MAGWARGISAGIQSSCKINSNLTGGNLPERLDPLQRTGVEPAIRSDMQFETPDRSQMFGYRAFTVSLDGLHP